jgi:predicted thioredoxin/glutaredoxin
LRLIIYLMIQGDVVPVMEGITSRLQNAQTSEMDASLVRYFVKGALDVVKPPVSLIFARSFGQLLQTSRCIDAVRSTYFGDAHRTKLSELIQQFGMLKKNGHKLYNSDESMFRTLARCYQES